MVAYWIEPEAIHFEEAIAVEAALAVAVAVGVSLADVVCRDNVDPR